FAGGTRDEILRAHLGEPPPAPSRLGAASPPELDALVLRLLAKRPADRLGYAADLATALHAMGHGAARGRPDPAGAQTLPYLYRAELSGRGELMARARRAIDALARERRGGAIYAGGESGAGKTRLGVEITREAAEAGATVVTGQCLPLGRSGATPLHPFLPLVHAAAARVHEGDEAAAVLAGARVLAPYFPELTALPGYKRIPAPAPLPPDAARARVLDALLAVAVGLAERSPLLLVLNDVQWSDELSLALLARLDPSKLASGGLLVLCLYRDEEAGEALLWRTRGEGVENWTVGRLDEDGIAAMAAGMLAVRSVPRAWRALLARVS